MKTKIISLLLCILSLSSCTQKDIYLTDNYFAMDTYITVKAHTESEELSNNLFSLLTEEENKYSSTIPDSVISQINNSSSVLLNKECAEVLNKIFYIAERTEGAFNPCLGQISSLWDITGRKYIPTDGEINRILPCCNHNSVTINDCILSKSFNETRLDLGAAIKGYAAEKSLKFLNDNGVENAMISIGGNIGVIGHSEASENFWRVGIKNPFSPDTIAGYIDCTDTVISVSGDYERYFEKDGIIYHHIFDSATGKPASSDIKSVAIIAKDGLVSDALSTAVFVMGSEKAKTLYNEKVFDFEAVIFLKDQTVFLTDGIKNKFTLIEKSGLTLIH